MRNRDSSRVPLAVLLFLIVLSSTFVIIPPSGYTSSRSENDTTPSALAIIPGSEPASVPSAEHASPAQNEIGVLSQVEVHNASGQIYYTQSPNWEGYVIAGPVGSIQNISGSWIVPSVACSQTPDSVSASWIGIDGWVSNTVEQIGTISSCFGSMAYYQPWYEFYPQDYMQSINEYIQPGDTISANVSTSGGIYYLSMCDASQGWCYQTSGTVNGGAADNSAEWITEAYSSCAGGISSCQEQPLANFGRTNYGEDYTGSASTNYAQIGGVSGPIGAFVTVSGDSVYNVEMYDCPSGCPALTSDLSADGTSFYTSWDPAPTPTLTMSCNHASAVVGSRVACKVKVGGSRIVPTGNLAWSSSGPGVFSKSSCRLLPHRTHSTCSVKFTPTAIGSVTLIASYGGDSSNSPSAGLYDLSVTAKTTKTSVSCLPTSAVVGPSAVAVCMAKVSGYLPTGTVSWYQSGMGSVSLSSTACTLTSLTNPYRATCSVTITGTNTGKVTLRAMYSGDSENSGSYKAKTLTVEL